MRALLNPSHFLRFKTFYLSLGSNLDRIAIMMIRDFQVIAVLLFSKPQTNIDPNLRCLKLDVRRRR